MAAASHGRSRFPPLGEVWPYQISGFGGAKECANRGLTLNNFRTAEVLFDKRLDTLQRNRCYTTMYKSQSTPNVRAAASSSRAKVPAPSSAAATMQQTAAQEEEDPLIFGVRLSVIKKNVGSGIPGAPSDAKFDYSVHAMPGYLGYKRKSADTRWGM
eukprot:TRINITY_DN10499_c0_g1_i1.p1 TRINITY_DN10499_c0_g1~~TRINITY_DN10499_c0_g1_i1.p1  ORF type:complete len:157 (-),score=23.21 TRINITY_DN10499_c0_g1_i1:96-566(-)